MATDGPKTPGTATDLATGGSWATINNAKLVDGNLAIWLAGISTDGGIKLTNMGHAASGTVTGGTWTIKMSAVGGS